ncbi:coiled-coil domain-containing protein [Limosilactobacillus reuteri]|uniref:hypothetical protein n=1 Tax=Limosilactobacillus reuteri TaxID=1598 RepID=UPI001E4749FC|nr:hypothetical protein [Limosilactobacillus reuteri]MCC4357472.1 hypothetical protein [Limosilactobacillus reuteri]MCC4361917.1 hypothetical protein [Limosilactobacillus reuteri]MCC4363694.1 hypothetical protein [Limosilactobacillus reuteri]
MIIETLKINNKEFKFNKDSNLIYSDKNSMGKTTLLRIILYSLGYEIPSTKGVDFSKLNISIRFIKNKEKYEIIRLGSELKLINIRKNKIYDYNVKLDREEILSLIYGVTEPLLVENILALHYFDQEKGWTLLNRGVAIGSNHFSIEEYLEGMTSDQLVDLRYRLKELQREQRTYRELKKIISIRNDEEYNQDLKNGALEEIQTNIEINKLKINKEKNEIKNYKKILTDNKKALNFIINLGIQVKVGSITTFINKENIVDFDLNQEIISTQIIRKKRELENLERDQMKLINEYNKSLSLLNINSELQKFNAAISQINVSDNDLEAILNRYKKEIRSVKNKIKQILSETSLVTKVYKRILSYTQQLGIEQMIDPNADFIFTNNLKRYSGANLHLLVFAFRLALLKELQLQEDELYPIIIDSPFSGEVDNDNVKKMFSLLKNEFSKNQLIVASIYGLSNIYEFKNKIILKNKLLN